MRHPGIKVKATERSALLLSYGCPAALLFVFAPIGARECSRGSSEQREQKPPETQGVTCIAC
jgi:hypothetical protein